MNVKEQFGNIDIYLFDQLLKGQIAPGMTILDAGCGEGRNLVHFLRGGYEVYAIDRSEAALVKARQLAEGWPQRRREAQFRQEAIEKLSFANDSFDAVICCAVLHFAENERHFQQMVAELWRVLRPGGLLFARLAVSIGLEDRIVPRGNGRYALPDGTERFLADEPLLIKAAEKLHAGWAEPLKTVRVGNERAMATWCLRKPHILFFDPIEQPDPEESVSPEAKPDSAEPAVNKKENLP